MRVDAEFKTDRMDDGNWRVDVRLTNREGMSMAIATVVEATEEEARSEHVRAKAILEAFGKLPSWFDIAPTLAQAYTVVRTELNQQARLYAMAPRDDGRDVVSINVT